MKKYTLLSILFVAFLSMTSCDEDDSTTAVQSSEVVGTWDISDFVTDSETIIEFDNQQLITIGRNELVSSNATITFNSDGTYTYDGEYELETFVDGQSVGTQVFDVGNGSGTWSVSGNVLTSSGGSPEYGMSEGDSDITELTPNRMVLETSNSQVIEHNGTSNTVNIDGVMTLTR
jgi:hypothetical protein